MNNAPAMKLPFYKRHIFLCLLLGMFAFVALVIGAYKAVSASGLFRSPQLGIIRIEGFIGDAQAIVDWSDKLKENPAVSGVLVRIDSPGGAVAPSQEIYFALKRLAETKPLVVSMGSIAASGGYYAAVAGQEIFANPSTLTGSIGVRLQLTNVQGLMERIGVRSENLTTGKLKAVGSPFQELNPEERAYLQEIIDDMQNEFVSTVVEARALPREAVLAVADGRALTGRQALRLKLIDALGDQQAALLRLENICGLKKKAELLEAPRKSAPWWKKLIETALELEHAQTANPVQFTFCY